MSPLLDPRNAKVGANENRNEDDAGRFSRDRWFESASLQRGVSNEPGRHAGQA